MVLGDGCNGGKGTITRGECSNLEICKHLKEEAERGALLQRGIKELERAGCGEMG